MKETENYISRLREKVGSERLIVAHTSAVIFDNEGRILLQKRGDTGKWGVPGGAMEIDEEIIDAFKREVKEETGLDVEPEGFLGIYTKREYEVTYPNGDKTRPIVAVFYSKVVGGSLQINGEETLDLGFFTIDNIPELNTPLHRDILEDAFKGRLGVYR